RVHALDEVPQGVGRGRLDLDGVAVELLVVGPVRGRLGRVPGVLVVELRREDAVPPERPEPPGGGTVAGGGAVLFGEADGVRGAVGDGPDRVLRGGSGLGGVYGIFLQEGAEDAQVVGVIGDSKPVDAVPLKVPAVRG